MYAVRERLTDHFHTSFSFDASISKFWHFCVAIYVYVYRRTVRPTTICNMIRSHVWRYTVQYTSNWRITFLLNNYPVSITDICLFFFVKILLSFITYHLFFVSKDCNYVSILNDVIFDNKNFQDDEQKCYDARN